MAAEFSIIDKKLTRRKLKYYIIQSFVAGLAFFVMLTFLHQIGGYAFASALHDAKREESSNHTLYINWGQTSRAKSSYRNYSFLLSREG